MKNKLYVASALVTLYAAGASDNNVSLAAVLWILAAAAFVGLAGWLWDNPKIKEKDSVKEPQSYNHGNYITKDKRCQGGRR